jgi:hypothetical protein
MHNELKMGTHLNRSDERRIAAHKAMHGPDKGSSRKEARTHDRGAVIQLDEVLVPPQIEDTRSE